MYVGYMQILFAYSLFKTLEYSQSLVSSRVPGNNPLVIPRDDYDS